MQGLWRRAVQRRCICAAMVGLPRQPEPLPCDVGPPTGAGRGAGTTCMRVYMRVYMREVTVSLRQMAS